jgi:hypothetical protein
VTAIVVDDGLLIDVLSGTFTGHPDGTPVTEIYTTGCWYYRVGRAAEASSNGALSRRIASLPSEVQAEVFGALADLPDFVRLLSLRAVVPTMARLGRLARLNMLSAEALAVASIVGGHLIVSTDSPRLRDTARDLRLAYHLVR